VLLGGPKQEVTAVLWTQGAGGRARERARHGVVLLWGKHLKLPIEETSQ
jgi:hypothetical protein